jgi:hypothetical protein
LSTWYELLHVHSSLESQRQKTSPSSTTDQTLVLDSQRAGLFRVPYLLGGSAVTADEFRSFALELPEAVEEEHMEHPDFRVRGKIFATLGPSHDEWGMVKLTPEQQSDFVRDEPHVFEPFPGAWGRRGCTKVRLEHAQEITVREALEAAWRNTAPRRLVEALDEKGPAE